MCGVVWCGLVRFPLHAPSQVFVVVAMINVNLVGYLHFAGININNVTVGKRPHSTCDPPPPCHAAVVGNTLGDGEAT